MELQLDNKYNELVQLLKKLDKVAIAFSGGVDSTFLVFVASQVLGDKVTAFTVNTPYVPDWEVEEAASWIQQIGVEHVIVETEIPENIKDNPPKRCYLCKTKLFTLIRSEANRRHIKHLLEGTNKDDEGDYRPGMKALEELGVLSPLRTLGMTKSEIRQLSKSFKLPTWSKPAYACLLTRIPYDTKITQDELTRIEKGELFLFGLGFEGVRLRSHGKLARLELQQGQFELISNSKMKTRIVEKMKSIGYQFVCIDLEGYRMGSYNDTIK